MEPDQTFHVRNLDQRLRTIKNLTGEDHIYDFGYMVQLLTALLDNLRQHALDAEIEDIAARLNDDQRTFLMLLAQYANLKTDRQIDEELDALD